MNNKLRAAIIAASRKDNDDNNHRGAMTNGTIGSTNDQPGTSSNRPTGASRFAGLAKV